MLGAQRAVSIAGAAARAAASLRLLSPPRCAAMSSALTPSGAVDSGTLLLAADEDKYDGIIVRSEALPSDPDTFAAALAASLQAWTAAGKRGVWLKLDRSSQAQLIPTAIAPPADFVFHHAERDYVMMTKWLPAQLPDTLPPNASHQVGVGAFVVNSRRELLVVQEASGPLRGQGFWKMPTGLVHAGEDLTDAVEREVLEETGVAARFAAVIAVRQAHGFAAGKSDMFFACGLELVEQPQPGSPVLRPCEREIAAVRWMPLEEYSSQPFFAKLPPCYHTLQRACIDWADGKYRGLQGRVFDGGSSGRPRRDLLLWGDGTPSTVSAESADGQ